MKEFKSVRRSADREIEGPGEQNPDATRTAQAIEEDSSRKMRAMGKAIPQRLKPSLGPLGFGVRAGINASATKR